MMKKLTLFWQNYKQARHTFNYFPLWKRFRLPPSHVSRKAEVNYYTLSFTQNITNQFRYKIKKSHNNLCRACKCRAETIAHIFLECPEYSKQRIILFKSSSNHKIQATLCNFLSHPRLKTSSEVFIQHTILSK